MSNTVQHKRGDTAAVNGYTGAVGEFVYNTTTKRIHTQDGATAGGTPLALLSDVPSVVGSVTSVAATVPTGFNISGSPITSSGTLAITYASGYQGFTTAESTKLSGIAAGATANQSDAYLLNRSNHTGTQAISTVTNLQTALNSKWGDDTAVIDYGVL